MMNSLITGTTEAAHLCVSQWVNVASLCDLCVFEDVVHVFACVF